MPEVDRRTLMQFLRIHRHYRCVYEDNTSLLEFSVLRGICLLILALPELLDMSTTTTARCSFLVDLQTTVIVLANMMSTQMIC